MLVLTWQLIKNTINCTYSSHQSRYSAKFSILQIGFPQSFTEIILVDQHFGYNHTRSRVKLLDMLLLSD